MRLQNKRRVLVVAGILVLAILAALVRPGWKDNRITSASWKVARAQIEHADGTRLFYVSATWCWECPAFEKTLHSDPLKAALQPSELREIDATSDDIWPDLQKLGIQSVPTLILIRGGQVRVLRGTANMPITTLTQFLNAT